MTTSRAPLTTDRRASARRLRPPRPGVLHLGIMVVYLVAGIAETWPTALQLVHGSVHDSQDVASYVWSFWWIAHQVTHLGNPWFTGYMAAPAGVQLGFDTLNPLTGLLLTPVTLAFGAGASYSLVVIFVPGLLCYAMYRLARLWVTSQGAAIAAGALFGLSTMLTAQDEGHINIAVGEIFLPLALEAAVRLRRSPGPRQAVILGLALGGVVLVNQESAILALILAAAALLPWLLREPRARKLRPIALAALTGGLVAAPQIIAMVQQARTGGAAIPAATVARWDSMFGVPPLTLFSPSPRVATFGLPGLAKIYRFRPNGEAEATFGLVLSVLAVAGLLVARRRRSAWCLALLWLGSAALSLGTALQIGNRTFVPLAQAWHGVAVSSMLPYTWFVRAPGLSGFREADRFTLLAIVPAALLAGTAVDWLLSRHRVAMIAALGLALLEAGWYSAGSIPTSVPALDGPIAADHSGSIVVDVPFGLRGGVPDYGSPMIPESLLLATEDAHPRAISYTSWVPASTVAALRKHPFYLDLVAIQYSRRLPERLAAARADARRMRVGWVLVWHWRAGLASYLHSTGFAFDYRTGNVSVYRPATAPELKGFAGIRPDRPDL